MTDSGNMAGKEGQHMNDPIDIVIPWVDGSDPKWQREKQKYMSSSSAGNGANSAIRYQSWDNLHYWFRAIEKYMPWINKIFLITWGHIPDFLNIEHPKLRLVKHAEYIPEAYLPTFNSNVIEMNIHRIQDLSENFILFNDDFFPLQPIKETYYFKNNIICDQAVESPIMPVDIGELSRWACTMKANNILIINKHFSKRNVQKENFFKWFFPGYGELLKRNIGLHYWYNFAGFHDPHMASAMKKSVLNHLWEIEPEVLDRSSQNKFRAETDISQYLIRYWQLCSGKFVPRKTKGKPFLVTTDNYQMIAEAIKKQKWQMVSLNESCGPDEFEYIKREINGALNRILPDKCTFEK